MYKRQRGYLFHLTPLPTTSVEREFDYHTNPVLSDTDMDGQPDNKDLIPLDYDMDGDGMINSLELVDSNSGNYNERLADCIANDRNLQRNTDGSYVADDDTDGDGILNTDDADTDNDGMPDQYEIDHGVANGGWQNPYVFNARYGLILAGGGDYPKTSKDNANFPANWIDSYELYTKLVDEYCYQNDNLYLLYSPWLVRYETVSFTSPAFSVKEIYVSIDDGPEEQASEDIIYWGNRIQIRVCYWGGASYTLVHTADNSYLDKTTVKYHLSDLDRTLVAKITITDYRWEDWSNGNPDVDDEMTEEGIGRALQSIGGKITLNDFLFASISTHGFSYGDGTGGCSLNRDHQVVVNSFIGDTYLGGVNKNYDDLNNMFNSKLHDNYARMVMVVNTCHSGTAISAFADNANKRIIITSAGDELSWTEMDDLNHGAFLHEGHHRTISFGTPIIPIPIDVYISGFTPNIGSISSPNSLFYAFEHGYRAAISNYLDIDGIIAGDYRSYPQLSSEDMAKVTYL